MSDVSWARIERGLWSRLDAAEAAKDTSIERTPSRIWFRDRRVWLAPVLAVAAAVLVLVLTRDTERGTLPATTASVPAGLEPSRVVTGAAPSSVSFGDAHIELAAESAIVMGHAQGAPGVLLEQGTATFAVAPRAERPPFIVRAGDTVVRVVGTRFSVAREEELVSVEVAHGIVEVQHRGHLQRVTAGQRWRSSEPDRVARALPAPRADDTRPPGTGHTAGDTASAPDVDARTPAPDGDHRTASPDGDHRTASPDGDHRTAASDGDHRTASPDGDHRTAASDTRPRTPRPDRGSRSEPPDTARATYERLVALEARDPERALTGYLELSRGGSKWAAVALYAAGRLAADRGDRRAETLLTIYLRRFPSGANADDARNLLERLNGAH